MARAMKTPLQTPPAPPVARQSFCAPQRFPFVEVRTTLGSTSPYAEHALFALRHILKRPLPRRSLPQGQLGFHGLKPARKRHDRVLPLGPQLGKSAVLVKGLRHVAPPNDGVPRNSYLKVLRTGGQHNAQGACPFGGNNRGLLLHLQQTAGGSKANGLRRNRRIGRGPGGKRGNRNHGDRKRNNSNATRHAPQQGKEV